MHVSDFICSESLYCSDIIILVNRCLTGVTGENCSECELNDHFLQAGGCQPCQCSSKGSVSLQCNDTGVCECKVS